MRKTIALIIVLIFLLTIISCEKSAEEKAQELFNQAQLYQKAEEYDKAVELYRDIMVLYPEFTKINQVETNKKECQVEYYFDKAKTDISFERYESAMDNIQELLNIRPDHIEGNYALGFIYLRLSYDYLISSQMMGLSYMDKSLLTAQSNAFQQLARERFKKCLTLNENHYAGHKGMAHIYISEGKLDQAIEETNKAITYAPEGERKATCMELMAQIYITTGNYEAAENTIKEIITKYPNRGETYLLYGNFYLAQNKIDEAIDTLKKGMELNFEQEAYKGKMLATISYAYSLKKDYKNAIEYIKKAIDIDIMNNTYMDQYIQLYAMSK